MGGLEHVVVAEAAARMQDPSDLFLDLTTNHEEITKESQNNHEKQSNVHALFTK